MKKVGLFISDLINALIGIPIGIGILELFNFTISIMMGEYVRIDGGNLELIIHDYTLSGIMGVFMAWIFIICNKIDKDENKDPVQKTKGMISSSWMIISILIIVYALLTSELLMAVEALAGVTIFFGGALLLVYVYDKKVIKQINSKIKENQNKKD